MANNPWTETDLIPAASYDASWSSLESIKQTAGFVYAETSLWSKWIVKIQFNQGLEASYGTAFYVNFPSPIWHVLLTAGHNLISSSGINSTDLKLLLPPGSVPKEIPIEKFFINPSFKARPNDSNKSADWGVILLPRSPDDPRLGFGFSMLYALDRNNLGPEQMKKENPISAALANEVLIVSGYRFNDNPGDPSISTGRGFVRSQDQLEYEITTQPGLSGSPVFLSHGGFETVVGIHNYGKDNNSKSKGSRLNFKMLRMVFGWAEIGWLGKRLKAYHAQAPPEGLYLVFPEEETYGWVYLGKDDAETKFDILPAETAPATTAASSKEAGYVFVPSNLAGGPLADMKWLLWYNNTVTLSSVIHPRCFVLVLEKKFKVPKAPLRYRLVFVTPEGRMEFKMPASHIMGDKLLDLPFRTAEVSFVPEKNVLLKYNYFTFE